MRIRSSVGQVAWVLSIGMLALVACGDPVQEAQSGPPHGGAHPFSVGEVDSHYELTIADRGTDKQQWGVEMGADTPYTAFEADGRVVVASIVPWEPMESSLKWASGSGDVDPEAVVLDDGRPASYGKGVNGAWDDLVIEVGPTEALRIASKDATSAQLVKFARHLRSNGDAGTAPSVEGAPPDWNVLGSVQADALIALRARVYTSASAAPGPASGYTIGWFDQRPPVNDTNSGSLAVMVLPGDSASLAALAVTPVFGSSKSPSKLKVGGRPALFFDGVFEVGGGRSVVTKDETGALIVVAAHGEQTPTRQELVNLASSVKPSTGAEWKQLQEKAFGGPRLSPDRGETELARGTVDGVEWLLQTTTAQIAPGSVGPDRNGSVVPLGPTSVRVDECLKLSNRERSCGQPSGGGAGGSVFLWLSSAPNFTKAGLPDYVMITTSIAEARRMRVTVEGRVAEADVHPVPNGSVDTIGAGVAFTDLPDLALIPSCMPDPPPAPEGLGTLRIDLLDASGKAVGCVG